MEYTQNNRGSIQFRERSRQIIDFGGLRYKNITPTDVDGLIEYKGKAYVLMEMKYGKAEMPYGQRLAIERMIDDFSKSGKIATAFLCEHYVENPNEDIDASKTIVRECYYNGKWHSDGTKTLKTRLDTFISFVDSF